MGNENRRRSKIDYLDSSNININNNNNINNINNINHNHKGNEESVLHKVKNEESININIQGTIDKSENKIDLDNMDIDDIVENKINKSQNNNAKDNADNIDIDNIDNNIEEQNKDNEENIEENIESNQNENENDDIEVEDEDNEPNIENNENAENTEKINGNNKKSEDSPNKDKKTRFPLAKIKNIIKLDDNVKLCQKNVYEMIGCITEHFLKELSDNCLRILKVNKRKTINIEDISCAVKNIDKYNFIDLAEILNTELIEDMKLKEEKVEKKLKTQLFAEEKQKSIVVKKSKSVTKTHNANNSNSNESENKTKSKVNTKVNTKTKNKDKQADTTMKIDSFFTAK